MRVTAFSPPDFGACVTQVRELAAAAGIRALDGFVERRLKLEADCVFPSPSQRSIGHAVRCLRTVFSCVRTPRIHAAL